MGATKLKNAPLKEVIFELHWELAQDDTGILSDPGFALAQGRFAERLKPRFPIHRKLISDTLPIAILSKIPLHQYWSGELEWPVVQHGQGMISINDTDKNYEWIVYKSLILQIISQLIESYDEPLVLSRLKLQYVDAWDVGQENGAHFMNQNLQTEIITKYSLPGEMVGFSLQQTFDLGRFSQMKLHIYNGINNQTQERSVIWTTTVEHPKRSSFEEIDEWLEFAHTHSSSMFKNMLKNDFYVQLDR